MSHLIDIIIPTWNLPEYFNPCLRSIMQTGVLDGLAHLWVVNNGKQPIQEMLRNTKGVTVLSPGENLGWEKGLAYAIERSSAPYVCFQNDDTHIPLAHRDFYQQLLYPFADTRVGAVGPSTTVASGWHSIFLESPVRTITEVPFLIFFTVMMSRAALTKAGGIDTSAPGGDDFDLSIRMKDAGYKLLVNPQAFLIHHAFKSGTRLKGDSFTPFGWNSREMTERTNQWLIQKHGFKVFFSVMNGQAKEILPEYKPDTEGDVCRRFVQGDRVLELGCGAQKTVPEAVGVDRISHDESVPHLHDAKSVADIVGNADHLPSLEDSSFDCLIARHILEHMIDPIKAISEWNRILELDGLLIVAVPDQTLGNTIPLNPEHVHAYTPESLRSLLSVCGFKQLSTIDSGNGVSFVSLFKKVSHVTNAHENKVELEVL